MVEAAISLRLETGGTANEWARQKNERNPSKARQELEDGSTHTSPVGPAVHPGAPSFSSRASFPLPFRTSLIRNKGNVASLAQGKRHQLPAFTVVLLRHLRCPVHPGNSPCEGRAVLNLDRRWSVEQVDCCNMPGCRSKLGRALRIEALRWSCGR